MHSNILYVDGTFSSVSGIQRIVDDVEVSYSQCVLLNEKQENEVNDRSMVKSNTLFCITMDEKSKESYVEMWRFIEEVYFTEYPNEPDLAPERIVLDFESANIQAVRSVFPQCEIQNCSFHLLKSVNKHFKKYFTFGLDYPIVKEIWTYIKGIPYVKWNETLVDEFFNILTKIAKMNKTKLTRRYRRTPEGAQKKLLRKEVKDAEEIITSTDKMIDYLGRTFLSSTHDIFGYEHWSIFFDTKDKTNNTSEVCNRIFNQFVLENHRAYTSFRRFVHMATRFITGRMDDEMVMYYFYFFKRDK